MRRPIRCNVFVTFYRTDRAGLAASPECGRGGLAVAREPGEHAGGKWRLRYESAMGGGGNLELNLNYMFREPLWPPVDRDSHTIGGSSAHVCPEIYWKRLGYDWGGLYDLFPRVSCYRCPMRADINKQSVEAFTRFKEILFGAQVGQAKTAAPHRGQ